MSKMMKLNAATIVNQAMAMILAAMVVGAGAIVFQASLHQSTAISQKVQEAKEELSLTQEQLLATQEAIGDDLGQLKSEIASLKSAIEKGAAEVPPPRPQAKELGRNNFDNKLKDAIHRRYQQHRSFSPK